MLGGVVADSVVSQTEPVSQSSLTYDEGELATRNNGDTDIACCVLLHHSQVRLNVARRLAGSPTTRIDRKVGHCEIGRKWMLGIRHAYGHRTSSERDRYP